MAQKEWLAREQALFSTARETERRMAAQRAALRLCCGLDLDCVLSGGAATKSAAIDKIRRLLRREQIKGGSGHYAYDINRQIALRQALNLLVSATAGYRSGVQAK
jgi:hypothetical protein